MKTAPKKATRIKAGRIQRANYKWIYLFLLPTIVIFAMFYLMPIAQVFVTSFTKWDGFNAPKFNGLTNYINLFTNSSFLIALKNLLWWCVIALTTSGGPGDDTMSLPIILVKGIMDYRYGYANAVGVVMFIIGLIVLGVVNKLFRMDEANY